MGSRDELEQLQQELVAAVAGLDAEQTQLRPVAARSGGAAVPWSIQQVVRHLLLSYEATTGAMQARLVKGTATMAKRSLLQRVGQFGLLRMQRFPGGRSAPAAVTPGSADAALDGAALGAEIAAAIARMAEHIDRAEALFGVERQAVSHMVLGPMNMAEWRRFHLVHARHHIEQIERIRLAHGLRRDAAA